MKIAFVLDDTIDSTDGVQQHVLGLSEWLTKAGHEVHYICGESKQVKPNIHSLAKNIRVSFNKNTLSIPLPVRSGGIKKLLDEQKFDVLHIQMPYSPFLAGKVIACAPSTTALVATFHIAPHSKLVSTATKSLAMVQKKSSHKLHTIISVSSVAQDFLKRSYNLNSQVIPNFIDLKGWPRADSNSKSIDVLFVGRLVERKGCRYLLEACRILVNEQGYQKLNVVIAGDGKLRDSLEKYVKDNTLQRNVTFAGFVSEQRKRSLMTKSKLTVLPSTGGESFGIVLLEAMAAGSVVLAGDNPGYAVVLNDAPQSLVKASSPAQISLRIDELLNDKSAYGQLKNQQQDILKQFDIESVGSAILKTYSKLVQQLRHKSNGRQR